MQETTCGPSYYFEICHFWSIVNTKLRLQRSNGLLYMELDWPTEIYDEKLEKSP
jgi:hypothetical protein